MRCARRRSAGKSAWWKLGTRKALVLWQRRVRRPPDPSLECPARPRPGGRAARARGLSGRARGRSSRRCPRRCIRRVLERPARGRHRVAVVTSGAGAAVRVGRPDDRHDRHRVGQVAVLQHARARCAVPRRQGARAVPLPDEGAGPGPGAGDQRVRADQAGAPRDLRRRHAGRAAPADPPPREPHPHQPRHAAHGDPAPPPPVGRLLLEPRGRRRRRGARLPRRVRLARRQRAAAAAADRQRLRHRAALPARQRDDRQPGRAGRAADRAWRRSRWSIATARPARGARSRCGTRR